METKIIKSENSETTATCKIDGDYWKNKQDEALKKLARRVQVKGFRKGEAPLIIARKYITVYQILEEAARICLDYGLNEVINQNKLQYYKVKNVSISKIDENEVNLNYVIITGPRITLGKYKGLDFKQEKVTVTKEDIDNRINKLLENEAELVLKDGPAEKGDTVILDFKGYIDGKEFEGGSANNYELVLGSNQFIQGFEDQLIGTKSNDKIDVNVTFPEHYLKEYAGKAAKFVCLIHEIKTKQLPELNDEFAASLGYDGVKTVEDLRKYEENVSRTENTNRAHEKLFRNILETIINNSTYNIHDEIIKADAEAIKNDTKKQIENNGFTYEQYKEMLGLSDEQLDKHFFDDARRRIVEYLTIIAIGQAEKITVTAEDLEKYYQDIANSSHMDLEKVKETLSKSENRIKQNLLESHIERFIIDSNIKVETKKTTKTTKKVEEKVEEPSEEKAEETKKEKKPAKKTTTRKRTTKKVEKVDEKTEEKAEETKEENN